MTAQTKISVRNLHKRFGPKVVLDGIDFDLHKGESLVVIGGSGTGKSVLIKCILGLLSPDSGSIKVEGEEVTKHRQAAPAGNHAEIRHAVSGRRAV